MGIDMSTDPSIANGPKFDGPLVAMMGSGPKKETIENEEFIRPELAVEINPDALHSLAESYPEHKEMFERFSQLPPMRFERGRVNYIFGPNGGGKSTLANAIYLAAKISHSTQETLDNPRLSMILGDEQRSPEDVRNGTMEKVLHPSRMDKYAAAEIIGMGASPLIVEEGALSITQFQARPGLMTDRDLKSDTPIVHRVAIQDMLGEERAHEGDYLMAERAFTAEAEAISGYGVLGPKKDSTSYAEYGASSRQMIENKLKLEFDRINPGSIVVMDEAAYGLSPKRQAEYIEMLENFAQEKDLIIVAPENSGFAFDSASLRVDLEDPKLGLHLSEDRNGSVLAEEVPIEAREALPMPAAEFNIDQDKLRLLAEANPKFGPMLETFAELPDSISFGPGKTEIFADNGGGKTTLLGVLYLLLDIEKEVQDRAGFSSSPVDEGAMRREAQKKLVTKPTQIRDQMFIDSIGYARELIDSGAVSLRNIPTFPKQTLSIIEGIDNVKWLNLLEVSGALKTGVFHSIGSSLDESRHQITEEMKQNAPKRNVGSTRQTSEALLFQTIQHMPEGSFLFVDEIDGGISPGRQLEISERVHRESQERGVTVVATSNSYEGEKFRLTPSLDLTKPEQGVIVPTHKRVQGVETN